MLLSEGAIEVEYVLALDLHAIVDGELPDDRYVICRRSIALWCAQYFRELGTVTDELCRQ